MGEGDPPAGAVPTASHFPISHSVQKAKALKCRGGVWSQAGVGDGSVTSSAGFLSNVGKTTEH